MDRDFGKNGNLLLIKTLIFYTYRPYSFRYPVVQDCCSRIEIIRFPYPFNKERAFSAAFIFCSLNSAGSFMKRQLTGNLTITGKQ